MFKPHLSRSLVGTNSSKSRWMGSFLPQPPWDRARGRGTGQVLRIEGFGVGKLFLILEMPLPPDERGIRNSAERRETLPSSPHLPR